MTASAYSPSWTKLTSTTAASSATVDFTNFNSEYAFYKVIIANYAPATDATGIWMRTSTNGGVAYDAGASDYAWAIDYASMQTATVATTVLADNADGQIKLFHTQGNAVNELASFEISIFRPSATAYCSVVWEGYATDGSTVLYTVRGSGARLSAGDVDAIRFLSSSGNIASGVFTLYGVK